MFFTSTITKKGYETFDSVIIRNEYVKTNRFYFDLGSIIGIQVFALHLPFLRFCGFFKMTRIARIQSMIAGTTLDVYSKTMLQFLKIVLYFMVFVNFLSCMWWMTIVSLGGSAERYGQDFDIDGYSNMDNDVFLDENDQKVPLDPNIVFQWDKKKYFSEDTWDRNSSDTEFNEFWDHTNALIKRWYCTVRDADFTIRKLF